jgi:hypothetical protein
MGGGNEISATTVMNNSAKSYFHNVLLFILASVIFSPYRSGARDKFLVANPPPNGIYASGRDWGRWDGPSFGHYCEITIHIDPPNLNPAWGLFPKEIPLTNGMLKTFMPSESWVYFWPTTSYVGMMSLSDEKGRHLTLLDPLINFPETYPESIKLPWAGKHSNGREYDWNGTVHPSPLIGTNATFLLNLTSYFHITRPGEYRLTVWPKIYRRMSTNDVECFRMDLAPVTIPFKWNGN